MAYKMKNALASVSLTIDIPEEKVGQILKLEGLDPENLSDADYEKACDIIHAWDEENWGHYLDWITGGEPEIEITA